MSKPEHVDRIVKIMAEFDDLYGSDLLEEASLLMFSYDPQVEDIPVLIGILTVTGRNWVGPYIDVPKRKEYVEAVCKRLIDSGESLNSIKGLI